MDIRDPIMDVNIVKKNEVIDENAADRIESLGIPSVQVRSPLTCHTARGVCINCYGRDLATGPSQGRDRSS